MKIVRVSGWRLRWWKRALVIEQPDTLLRWYRDLFRRLWKHGSRSKGLGGRPPLPKKTVALIKQMARDDLRGGQATFAEDCESWDWYGDA